MEVGKKGEAKEIKKGELGSTTRQPDTNHDTKLSGSGWEAFKTFKRYTNGFVS